SPVPVLFPYTTLFRSRIISRTNGRVFYIHHHFPFHALYQGQLPHYRYSLYFFTNRSQHNIWQFHTFGISFENRSFTFTKPNSGRSEEHTSELQSREKI